jgi:PAX-interacting protein 1
MLQAVVNFFRPKDKQQVQQQQQQGGQIKQFPKVQKPPLQQTKNVFVQQQQTKNQQQQGKNQQQQQQQQGVVQFVPKQNMPSLTQRSQSLTGQQLTTASQLTDAITRQVNQQARQSGQQLAQAQKQKMKQTQLQQARNAHAQVLSYASEARSLLNEIKQIVSARRAQTQQGRLQAQRVKAQTQQSKLQAQRVKKDVATMVAELRLLLDQISTIRQQGQRVQNRHIRQLQQIKRTLLSQCKMPIAQCNKNVIQHITPYGNKLKIAVDIKQDIKQNTKCGVF